MRDFSSQPPLKNIIGPAGPYIDAALAVVTAEYYMSK